MPVKLSPRETRLLGFLKAGQWSTSTDLVKQEFRGKKHPENARLLVTVAMWRLMSKLKGKAGQPKLEKRGGGRAGTEYTRR